MRTSVKNFDTAIHPGGRPALVAGCLLCVVLSQGATWIRAIEDAERGFDSQRGGMPHRTPPHGDQCGP